MMVPLEWVDFEALSPLLILFVTALGTVLVEAFGSGDSKKITFYLTAAGLIAAFLSAVFAPASENPLLTPWIRFDSLSSFFTLFFLGTGLASTFLAATFFQRFEASQGEYYFLLTSAVIGLILIAASADLLTLFLGLETLSIALYVLCCYMKKWSVSSESGIKYFLNGSLATALLLYGIALIYGAVGTTALTGLLENYQKIANPVNHALFLGGIGLLTVGLGFKAALVPFHVWAPDVYDGAPNPVTAFMAVGTKAGAIAAFARLFLVALPQFDPIWSEGVSCIAIATMVYANSLALLQVQLRRFFAYSGISHAGFLMIPIIAGTEEAIPLLEFYLVVYALATLGAFAVLGILDDQKKGVYLKDLQGLFMRSPWLAAILTLSLLTLAGIPPTAGFFAKFYLFKAAFQAGYTTLVIVGLLTTVLAVFYYVRIVSIMAARPTKDKAIARSFFASAVGGVSFVVIVFLSLYPSL